MGIIIGYFLGNILYNFALQVIFIDPVKLYWIVVLSSIALFTIFSAIFRDSIIVLTTSLLGAYAAVRGFSILTGQFPDELYTAKLISYGEFNELSRVFGGSGKYLLLILVFFIIGCIVQGAIAGVPGFPAETKANEKKKDYENKEKEPVKKDEEAEKKEEESVKKEEGEKAQE